MVSTLTAKEFPYPYWYNNLEQELARFLVNQYESVDKMKPHLW
jgi:hypothetical protein